jgi:hypothetical protein
MNYGSMAYIHVFFDEGGGIGSGMDNAVFLHVGTITDYNTAVITSQYPTGANETLSSHNDITNQDGVRMNKTRFIQLRHLAFKLIKRHVKSFFQTSVRQFIN